MKRRIGFLALVLFFAGCTSDNDMHYKDSDKVEKKDAKSENTAGGIENVNGGIPDTTNTINITGEKRDTLLKRGKDSLR
ncbi:MAG: hypothetical protein ABI691_07060 [Ginsengibacter sp.]